ncbi:hypothetical protein Xbed_03423 [Xenorhabdus beddingii]|uniref:Uncharacterized protein n=1 Tax=Xenorhabdus beddingii TaxID=40578 RepID=A0A1Y2SDC8_9GAMM|nr:hypothetical protein [Xenorhabdus beddingii]OTA16760.1 hypothetical protein Xbed_03423 [Xenorhabdus beddingii]
MGSLKDYVDIKKLVITVIVVVFLLYCAISGNITGGNLLGGNGIPTREKILATYPMFEALNKIDPDKFESLYKELESIPQVWHKSEANKAESNEAILKFIASINVWFGSNISTLLNSSSDEAVNKYGSHLIKSLSILLKNDPTGLQCFNTVYPGVIGELDVFKLKDDIKGIAYERNYLNSIADSIARHDKIDRLPVEQIEEALSIINDKLVEKYGDAYYIEDPQELAKQPSLVCRKTLDLLREVLALDPHLSAEILRYMNEPE